MTTATPLIERFIPSFLRRFFGREKIPAVAARGIAVGGAVGRAVGRQSFEELLAATRTAPDLYEATTWVKIQNGYSSAEVAGFANKVSVGDFFHTSALHYISAIALFFEHGADHNRPACTLANVVATVMLVDYEQVLALVATDAVAAEPVAPLFMALEKAGKYPVASILPVARALVTEHYTHIDRSTAAAVVDFFASHHSPSIA